MRTRHRAATLLVAVIGLATAGCATSDDETTGQTQQTEQTEQDTATVDDAAVADTLDGVTADMRRDPG